MARPKKVVEPVEEVQEIVEPVESIEDTEISKIREIEALKEKLEVEHKELLKIRTEKRKEYKQATIAECMQATMRDDANSEKKELQKIVKIAQSKLNSMR